MATVHVQAFGELNVTERMLPPGHRQGRHEHERPSVYLFLAGSSSESYGTRDRDYSESSVVVNPAGARHAVRCGPAGCRIVNVEIGAAHLQRLRVRAPILERVEEIRGGRVEGLMRQIHAELHRRELAAAVEVDSLVCELLAVLARDARQRDDVPRWLPRIRELLHDSPVEPGSLSQIAELVRVHPTHLARAFRRHQGCTVGEFVRRIRIQQACDRLARSDASIAEIAMSCGFADQSHLGRTFKRMLGMTPAAYRTRTRLRSR